MCDKFLMGCALLTAFVHLCVLFSGILVHLVTILTGYVDTIILLLNRIVFLESMYDLQIFVSLQYGKYELNKRI